MTILEAIQSLTEYENDNLLSKVLSDFSLTGSDAYVSSTHEAKVDLCAASIFDYLALHPEFREGKLSLKYDAKSLFAMAKKLRQKHGMEKANISGVSRW